jgi:hypothetical protein
MFDPVTDEALRLRRMGVITEVPVEGPVVRSSLVCSVCQREIRPEEQVFWVGEEVHCFQCHDMLRFEYDKERQVDRDVREKGTRWIKEDE